MPSHLLYRHFANYIDVIPVNMGGRYVHGMFTERPGPTFLWR
jgi:hypothetical protein